MEKLPVDHVPRRSKDISLIFLLFKSKNKYSNLIYFYQFQLLNYFNLPVSVFNDKLVLDYFSDNFFRIQTDISVIFLFYHMDIRLLLHRNLQKSSQLMRNRQKNVLGGNFFFKLIFQIKRFFF